MIPGVYVSRGNHRYSFTLEIKAPTEPCKATYDVITTEKYWANPLEYTVLKKLAWLSYFTNP
jgi:hypothetical protein